ncbi:hypothetical protein [Microvirga lotononidis]|uniref:Uncharacterized protein n=1 Tax=Microvirga lotononidis TaxID=864069 RepID=I4YVY9_9HYPH|nr:hypothetical protein [Microvirga lotononidis]EIM28131.1 hypothetical protein MicloDRAFT_00047090 [Microvirga lotononidis]WQO27764.1 hypothetical protein U0023_01245 [Microvirga lotononidis]
MMSTERAEAALELAIAKHVAISFQRSGRNTDVTIAARSRSRITDSFRHGEFQTEQDNRPPALVAFYRNITAAFAPVAIEPHAPERSSHLYDIKDSLVTLRGALSTVSQKSRMDHAKIQLLIERQQLLVKNQLTEGFGRIESWILSLSFLGLVLLNAVSLLWALPFLGFSIGRAWYLDRTCKRRLRKISDIDALIDRIERAS